MEVLKFHAQEAAKSEIAIEWIDQATRLKQHQDFGIEARELALKILRRKEGPGDMERLTFLCKTYGITYGATTKTMVALNKLLGFEGQAMEPKGTTNIQVNMIDAPYAKTTNAEWREKD